MPHVPQITTPEDFIKSDPSLPIPQGIRRTSEHDPDSFTILAGTFRHRLPKSLINAYASFVRDTQNESAFLRNMGGLLSMSISPTSVTSLPFRTLPAYLGRFLANTLDLTLVGLSPFALERSKSYRNPPTIYVPNSIPTTAHWQPLDILSNSTTLPRKPSLMCINDASETFNQQIIRHILSLTAQNLPVLLVIEDSQKSGSQPWLETLNSHNSRAHLLLDIPPNMLPWSSLHGYPQETVDGSKDSIKHF
jgi:hypothetical protein